MSGPSGSVPDYTAIADRLRVSPETAREDVANALCILTTRSADEYLTPSDAAAIRARLESALRKMGTSQ